MASHRSAPRRRPPNSPFKDPVEKPVEQYAVDDRVSHDTFGLGRVVGVEPDTAVLVDFGGRGERITSPYPKLNKL